MTTMILAAHVVAIDQKTSNTPERAHRKGVDLVGWWASVHKVHMSLGPNRLQVFF